MNANELAKKLEKTGWVSPLTETECFEIATMLRQLQAEKEALKSKTLTDEEIRKVADEVFKNYKNWHHYQIDFARAILRKAQEK